MFGTATAGSSHGIRVIAGPVCDGDSLTDGAPVAGAAAAGARTQRWREQGRGEGAASPGWPGWDLRSPDGLHAPDEHDGDDTLYLILCHSGTGQHLGSVRLLPSTAPHGLRNRFTHLCADGVPVGPDVWEISRLVTAPGLSRPEALQVRGQLAVALLEHAFDQGISRYTMVANLPWLASVLSIGWDAEPLGMPHGEGTDAVAAMQIRVDGETLDRLRAAWGAEAPLLYQPKQIGREAALAS